VVCPVHGNGNMPPKNCWPASLRKLLTSAANLLGEPVEAAVDHRSRLFSNDAPAPGDQGCRSLAGLSVARTSSMNPPPAALGPNGFDSQKCREAGAGFRSCRWQPFGRFRCCVIANGCVECQSHQAVNTQLGGNDWESPHRHDWLAKNFEQDPASDLRRIRQAPATQPQQAG